MRSRAAAAVFALLLLALLTGCPGPGDPASADRPGGGYEQAMAEGAEGLRIGLLGGDFRLGLPAETIAVLPYAQRLWRLPAYL